MPTVQSNLYKQQIARQGVSNLPADEKKQKQKQTKNSNKVKPVGALSALEQQINKLSKQPEATNAEEDKNKYDEPIGPVPKDKPSEENKEKKKQTADFNSYGLNTDQARSLSWLAWLDSMGDNDDEKEQIAKNLGINLTQLENDYGNFYDEIQQEGKGGSLSDDTLSELNKFYTDYGGDILSVDIDNYKSEKQALNTEAQYAQKYYTVGIDMNDDGVADFNLLTYETEAGQLDNSLKSGTIGDNKNLANTSDSFMQKWKDEARSNDLTDYLDSGNSDDMAYDQFDLLTQQAYKNKMLDEVKDVINNEGILQQFEQTDSEGNYANSYKDLVGGDAANQFAADLLNGKAGFKGLFDTGKALDESIGAAGMLSYLQSGPGENGLEENLTIADSTGETNGYELENSTESDLRDQISGQQMYEKMRKMDDRELARGLGTTVVPREGKGVIKDTNTEYGVSNGGYREVYPSNYGDIKRVGDTAHGNTYSYVDGQTQGRPNAEEAFEEAKDNYTNKLSSNGTITLSNESSPSAYDSAAMLTNKFLEEGSRGELQVDEKLFAADEIENSKDLSTRGQDQTPAGYQNAGFYGYSNRDDNFAKDNSSAPSAKSVFGEFNTLPVSSPQEKATQQAKRAQDAANTTMRKIQQYGDRNNPDRSAYDFRRNNSQRNPRGYNISVPVVQASEEGTEKNTDENTERTAA